MWLKENRENRITCIGGCSSFRGSISLRDFSSCGPNLRAQIGWGRNLVSETRASSPLFGKSSSAPFYIHNHRCNRRFRNLVSRHRGTASDITRYRSAGGAICRPIRVILWFGDVTSKWNSITGRKRVQDASSPTRDLTAAILIATGTELRVEPSPDHRETLSSRRLREIHFRGIAPAQFEVRPFQFPSPKYLPDGLMVRPPTN